MAHEIAGPETDLGLCKIYTVNLSSCLRFVAVDGITKQSLPLARQDPEKGWAPTYELRGGCDETNRRMLDRLYGVLQADASQPARTKEPESETSRFSILRFSGLIPKRQFSLPPKVRPIQVNESVKILETVVQDGDEPIFEVHIEREPLKT